MKRWALLTVAIYFLMLAILSVPGLLLAFAPHPVRLAEVFTEPVVWIWGAIMASARPSS